MKSGQVVFYIGILIILILVYKSNKKSESFSLSKKPMETENNLLHVNYFDDIDYQTPFFVASG